MLYADDLTEGQEFQLGIYRIEEGEILEFARRYDPVPIHTDPEWAKTGPFGGLIASGFHTLAVYQRLVVESVWTKVAGIVGRSFEIKLHRPVRPGMVLTGKTRINTITLRPERRNAVVLMQTEIANDAGEAMLTLVLDTLIHMRPAPA